MKKTFILSVLFITLSLISLSPCFSEDISQYMFRPEPVSLSECERIKDQYGISVCTVDGDYWVGAVKACGGVDNLPSSSDFRRIKNNILDSLIYDYNPSYFNEYYANINSITFYSNEPYQKKPVDENANWLVKKWQNWRYNVNYNKIHGYKLSINSYYASLSALYELDRNYDRYVSEETQRVEDWNNRYPDDKITLDLKSKYEWKAGKLGSYFSNAVYRDNYDLNAYCICRSDLLR